MAKEKTKINGSLTDLIIHPGLTLKEVLEDRNIDQKYLAACTSVSPKHVSEIISGKKDISISYAKKLEYALGIESSFWINLQSTYDKELYEYEEINQIKEEEFKILKQLKEVVKEFEKMQLIDLNEPRYIQVLQLRGLLSISNLCDIPKASYAAAYKIKNNVNPYVLFAWQKLCEIRNKNVINNINKLSVEKLIDKLEDIKKTMLLEVNDMRDELIKIFAECGIIFDIVPNFVGAPVQGYIKQMLDDRLLLCLTIRGKFADIFWFSLFHEIGHIVHGDTKNIFIDFDNSNEDIEALADQYAKNALINNDSFNDFLQTDYLDLTNIKKFAKRNNVDSTIVIGRLLKEDRADYSIFGKLRKKYVWDN